MDATRKKAYRELLYRAMTYTRSLLSIPVGHPEERMRADCAYVIADLMHNLASSSARDFDGFNEDWFWSNAAEASTFHLRVALLVNRDAFERRMIDAMPTCAEAERELPDRSRRDLPEGWRIIAGSRGRPLH
jgi:hypothetical protein